MLHASVFEQPLCRTGFSLTLSSYHLSHVARWHIGEGLSFERTIQRQVLSDAPHFPTKSACNCPLGTETLWLGTGNFKRGGKAAHRSFCSLLLPSALWPLSSPDHGTQSPIQRVRKQFLFVTARESHHQHLNHPNSVFALKWQIPAADRAILLDLWTDPLPKAADLRPPPAVLSLRAPCWDVSTSHFLFYFPMTPGRTAREI